MTKIFCDSSTHEACIVIEGQKTTIIPYPKPVTNNVGEYQAVILGVEKAIQLEAKDAEILTDSLLVVNQVNGSWKCRMPHLLPFRDKVGGLLENSRITLEWVPREENLAGKVLG